MNVSGNNNQQKLRIVQQAIGDIDEFIGIKLTHYGKVILSLRNLGINQKCKKHVIVKLNRKIIIVYN